MTHEDVNLKSISPKDFDYETVIVKNEKPKIKLASGVNNFWLVFSNQQYEEIAVF